VGSKHSRLRLAVKRKKRHFQPRAVYKHEAQASESENGHSRVGENPKKLTVSRCVRVSYFLPLALVHARARHAGETGLQAAESRITMNASLRIRWLDRRTRIGPPASGSSGQILFPSIDLIA